MAGIPGLGFLEAGVGALQTATGLIGMRKKKREAQAAIDAIGTYTPDQGVLQATESAKMRSTKGLSGSSRKLATEGIESAAMTAYKQAKDLRSGQGLVGTGEAMRQKGALQLAKMEEEAKVRNEQSAMSAARVGAAEKEKGFKSAQEKQSLKANVALQEVAAKRAAVSQGLGAIAGGLSAGAMMGEKNPLGGLLSKGVGAVKGLFGKSLQNQLNQGQENARQLLKRGAPQVDSYIEAPTQ